MKIYDEAAPGSEAPLQSPGAPGNVGEPSELVSTPQPDIQGLGPLDVMLPRLASAPCISLPHAFQTAF